MIWAQWKVIVKVDKTQTRVLFRKLVGNKQITIDT